MGYEWILWGIYACCAIGITVNTLVIYIVHTASERIGSFKYFLMYFATIEIGFGFVSFMAQPFFYAYDNHLIGFSENPIPLFADTFLGKVIMGLYCSLYEIWMGVVVVLFLFKYIVLCRNDIVEKIEAHPSLKVLLFLIYMVHFTYSMICGMVLCNSMKLSENTMEELSKRLNGFTKKTYVGITFKGEDERFSGFGFVPAFGHIGYATILGVVTVFCGRRIWQRIKEMQRQNGVEYARNLQIFYTLVMQAAIPFFLYQLPTSIFALDALLEHDPILGPYTPIWPLCIALPKIIDPFMILFLIKDYRMATLKLFCCYTTTQIKVSTVSDVTSNLPTV